MSCLSFASLNGIIKVLLGQGVSSLDLALGQNACLCVYFFFHQRGSLEFLWQKGPRVLQILRGVCAAAGVVCFYQALGRLGVIHTMALGCVGPVITLLGGVFFLKEPMNTQRMYAILLGMVGGCVLSFSLVQTMQGTISGYTLLWSYGATIFFSANTLLSRYLTAFYTSSQLLLSLFLFTTPVLIILHLFQDSILCFRLSWMMVPFILISLLAYISMMQALRYAQVTLLLPVGSIRFLCSMALGYVFFQEPLPPYLWGGLGCLGLSLWWLKQSHR